MIKLEMIRDIFVRHGLGKEFSEQEPLLRWSQACGQPLARLTSPLRVSQGVLYVGVANHVIAQELSLMKEVYLQKLRELLAGPPLKDIRFRVSPQLAPPGRALPDDEPAIQLSLLDFEEQQRILDELHDASLREAFARLLDSLARADRARQLRGGRRCSGCGVHFEGQGSLCFNCQLERGA
ncbi:MAG TPA: DUF721 domain-containing protein [Candidatus Fraserbacteria bacterium]|nr:DUF721 domain-containing protein [Candidatus Fraserbacteria bacterium]